MATVTEALSLAFDHYEGGRLAEAEELCRRILAVVPEEATTRHLLGIVLSATGRLDAAVCAIGDAIALTPDLAEPYRHRAAILHALGRSAESLDPLRALSRLVPQDHATIRQLSQALADLADAALDHGDPAVAAPFYREAAALAPESVELRFNLAIAERDSGSLAEASASFAAAARLRPELVRAHLEHGLIDSRLGRAGPAADAFHRVLALAPAEPDALCGLGSISDHTATALVLLNRAAAVRPDHEATHATAALLLHGAGRWAEAAAACRRALVARPAFPEAQTNLCAILNEQGGLVEAARQGQRAVQLDPGSADALLALGNAFQTQRALAGAQAIYRMAIARRPDFAAAHGNLGTTLYASGRPADACASLRRALALRPDERTQYANLGLALKDMGRVPEALASYRRALAIDPGWAEAHSDMIFAMDFDPDLTTADLQAERRAFNRQHGVPLRPVRKVLTNDRNPERRLRIGHVTADFRANSAAFAFGPILREMNREQFDIVCYSGVTAEDDLTRRFRGMATEWRSTVGVDDEALADRIRSDGIDILVDMSGHSSGNRQTVFARRPAPIQVTAWTHPHGIGLETMDYMFTDPVVVPEAEWPLFQEEPWYLSCVIPFEAPDYAPPVLPLPSLHSGRVTFGCLNRLSKVTDPVIRLWARVLNACPDTDLLLKDKALNDPAEQDRLHRRFAGLGIDPTRIRFLGGSGHVDHLAASGLLDIALDPFPLNGGITTMECLWMGVPVVALRGAAPPSRVSASINIALGLADWVAETPDDYIAIARAKSADPIALAALRARLRDRLKDSPIGDPLLYTREVEQAYRAMWRRWCAGQASESGNSPGSTSST